MILALDVSMRCTGVCILSVEGELIDFGIVSNSEILDEELLDKNWRDVQKIIKPYKDNISHIVIEGLSFQSASKCRDLIDGNFWSIRHHLWKMFRGTKIEIVPVSRWRKLVIPIERQRELKELIKWGIVKKNNWQKIECVYKLPDDVKEKFEDYLEKHNYKNGLFDLTDSYFIGQYIVNKQKT